MLGFEKWSNFIACISRFYSINICNSLCMSVHFVNFKHPVHDLRRSSRHCSCARHTQNFRTTPTFTKTVPPGAREQQRWLVLAFMNLFVSVLAVVYSMNLVGWALLVSSAKGGQGGSKGCYLCTLCIQLQQKRGSAAPHNPPGSAPGNEY